MDWSPLLAVSFGYSAVFCVVFTALLVGSVLAAQDSFVHDYPPAIKERYGEKSAAGKRVTVVASVLMFLAYVLTPIAALVHLEAVTGVQPGFGEGFFFGVVMFVVTMVFDTVIIDWWLICTVQPRLFVLPGTEGMPEYGDKMFHVKVLVPTPIPWPLLMIPAYGLIVGGVTAAVAALA